MIVKIYNLIFPWVINNILKILKLKKRNENLWIFGAWGGDNYSDNSKYLFEYVIEHLPNINAVWITKKPDIKEKLNLAGKKCYLFNEPNGRITRLAANYVFFTNGMTDFGKYDLCHGATKVALWHGMPLKKLWFATNNLQKRDKNIFRLLQYIVLKIYNHAKRDFTIATSETTKKLLIECFEVKPETVLITGQPRNDGLFNTKEIHLLKQKLNHNSNDKFVLYMPTWREMGNNEIFLENILNQLINDSAFLDSLNKNNIKLYVKPHPRITINTKSTKNIIVLKGMSDIDNQVLIGAADELITDYSSVFIDYALLERPVHFFVPDLEEYKKDRLGLFFSFEDFVEDYFTDINELKKVILNSTIYAQKGINNSLKVNSLYNDPMLPKGKYCDCFTDTFLYCK
ncbi:CDP-glycerol glycerophosphotransferase [Tangfeifania diversioriginum]|uniref:CDP-glycerol glycerophosphotransferase n=1 Tax=Tangfeifania diversioriginum TaxID=1168035 RepID=A0A1M6MI04_9BACT|nr:CDP-glycerol glycerophosphotransferase family protein [Tangfeifania diversioriginum]SHJ83064.1 CDP-glycerol glycerophosphotransferase [Tangfeifania diversioriginum]